MLELVVFIPYEDFSQNVNNGNEGISSSMQTLLFYNT